MSLLVWGVALAQSPFGAKTVTQTAQQTEGGVAELFTRLAAKIPGIIAGIVVILIAFIMASLAKRAVLNKVSTHISSEENESVLVLIGRATHVSVLSVGLAIGLKFWGVDIDALLAAFGFGIAFAMRDIMINFIAGILVLVARHFGIGDFIEVGGNIKGKVIDIQGRATILQGLDGTKIIVPNKDIFNKEVVSYTTNPYRRIDLLVGVDYRTDLDIAQKVIVNVLKHHKAILKEPAPQAVLDEFADSSINVSVRFWVESKSHWVDIKSEIVNLLKKALDQHKITIPFPMRTIVEDDDNPAGPGEIGDLTEDTEPAAPLVPQPVLATANDAPVPTPEIPAVAPEVAPVPEPEEPQEAPQPKSEDTGADFLKK